ncbi:hypothetical protein C4565_06340 [Candidatus Parcubacteria bacterium]|jgi:hypothetical protein|nr:MAG: hypothetical protein C4565_06340 [Candidatus Parcubacteria bacterium]
MEKKIFLEKNDGLEVAVEHLIHVKSDTIILNIPKDSVLGRSVNNFHVLKREGNTAGKTLMIESIDDHILELASLATITAINPVFQKKERAVSDILPRASVLLKKKRSLLDAASKKLDLRDQDSFLEKTEKDKVVSRDLREDNEIFDETAEGDSVHTSKKTKKRSHRRRTLLFVLSSILLGLALCIYLGWFVLPRATVTVTLKQKRVPFDQLVEISQNNTKSGMRESTVLLRGQLMVSQGNISLPVSGVDETTKDSSYAEGVVSIVNEYGTSPQKLVATTRFETPDGKVFRLRSGITVPGGKMVGGVLKPGIVDAEVIADKPGEQYNIGPVERFSIPGFKGTPRFDKFYGFSKADMVGGSSALSLSSVSTSTNGESEQSIIEKLQTSLETKMQILDSAKLTIPDGARLFTVTKKDIQISSSGPLLYVEGTLKEIGFNEKDLYDVLGAYLVKEAGEKMRVRKVDLSYSTSTPNFSSGSVLMKVKGDIIYESDTDIDALKTSVLGKSTNEVKAYMLSVPGVESAKITFRFPWTVKIPKSESKVDFIIE